MDDELHRLIRSLTKSEKRYFRLTASTHRREAAYLRLFDLLDRQPVYDAAAVRTFLAEGGYSGQAHVARSYLKKLILKSLRLYNAGRSRNAEVKELLEDAQILIQKGLHDLAAGSLARARRVAEEAGLLHQLLEVHIVGRVLATATRPATESSGAMRELERIYRDEQRTLSDLGLVSRSRWTFDLLTAAFPVRDRRKVEELRRAVPPDVLDGALPEDASHRARRHVLYTQMNFLMAACEYDAHERACLEFIDMVRRGGDGEKPSRLHLVAGLDQLVRVYFKQWRHREVAAVVAEMRSLVEDPEMDAFPATRAGMIEVCQLYELNILVEHGRFAEAHAKVRAALAERKLHVRHLSDDNSTALYFLFAVACFGAGDHRAALRWLRRVQQSAAAVGRDLLDSMSRVLGIIIHLESGREERLEALLRSYHRYLARRADPYRVERIMLESLRRLLRLPRGRSHTAELRRLRAELIACSADPFETQPFEFFDLISWVESRIERKELSAVVERNAALRTAAHLSMREQSMREQGAREQSMRDGVTGDGGGNETGRSISADDSVYLAVATGPEGAATPDIR